MINLVWVLLMAGGIGYAALTGQIDTITPALVAGGEQAVALCLGLLATLGFWLGLARIAEKSGMLYLIARIISPCLRPFFPSLARNKSAMQNIVLNFSANLLGMGNAATPFGLQAMQAMQAENPDQQTASDAMCTLLVLNTAGLALLPTTVIALRVSSGSGNPTATVGVTLIAGCLATGAGLFADRLLRNRSRKGR